MQDLMPTHKYHILSFLTCFLVCYYVCIKVKIMVYLIKQLGNHTKLPALDPIKILQLSSHHVGTAR